MLGTPKAHEADRQGKGVSQSDPVGPSESGGKNVAEGAKELWPTREKS